MNWTFIYILENVKFDLIRWTWKKRSNFVGDYKSGWLISGHWEQQFKIQSHSIIFDPVNVEGQWYGGRASQALKSICELFGNI